jgi:ATP-dependent Lon protease
VRGRASFALLGNIDAPPREVLEESHLFSPLPRRIEDDTALMDRVHAYLPGWEVPKVAGLAEGLGLTAPYLAECLSRLRDRGLSSQIEDRVAFRGNLSREGRDGKAALRSASGLLKLIYPGLVAEGRTGSVEDVPRAALRWALWLAVESRLRVRQQQHHLQPEEFAEGDFRFEVDPASEDTDEERVFLPEEEAR